MTASRAVPELAFRAGHARSPDCRYATEEALRQLGPVPPGANLGFLYVADRLAGDATDILAHARAATGVDNWVGTVGIGVLATGVEYMDEPAVALMVGAVPEGEFKVFSGKSRAPQLGGRGMAWLQSTYTIRLNHRHQIFGHVLSGRYKAQLVEGSGNGYLKSACDYVHLNPVRANLLKSEERLLSYPWSSLGGYLAAPEHRPEWIRVDRLLGEHGIQEDTAAARQQFEQRMETRRWEETDPEAQGPAAGLVRGQCWLQARDAL